MNTQQQLKKIKATPPPTGQDLTKKSLEKLPPYDLEAEQAVLGAILLDNQAIFTALEFMEPDDFHRKSHQKIFEAMLMLIDERTSEADLLTLRDELERRDQLTDIGGPAFLASLVDQVPTAANIEYHAKLIHEKAIIQQLFNNSIEIASRCLDDSEPAGELLENAEQKIFAIADKRIKQGFISISPVIDESVDYLEEICKKGNRIIGVPTGFQDLDNQTAGLHPSELIILAGRPSMGKTSLCLGIADYVSITQKLPSGLFSLEMSQRELGLRLLSLRTRIDLHKIRTGRLIDEDWDHIFDAQQLIRSAPFYIDDTPALQLLELRAKARRLKREKDIQLLLIDYLTLIRPNQRYDSEYREVTEISRSLKALAKELDMPILVLSQLNRDCEKRADKRPQLSDLRASGAIEQDADVVLFIYRPEVYGIEGTEGLAEIIIGKQRNGPTGSVQLAFLKEYTRFENLETMREETEEPEQVF